MQLQKTPVTNGLFDSQKNFNGIDLIKFICAFLIISIHMPVFTTSFGFERAGNFLIEQFARVAVPFYFTASGFLLFRKTDLQNPDMTRVKNYCFRLLRIFGIWSLALILGGKYQLWYFGGVIEAVLILSLLLKSRLKPRLIIIIATVLFVIGLIGDSYYGFFSPIKKITAFNAAITIYKEMFFTTRNGLFFGFPYVLMGALFSHYRIKMNMIVAFVGFAFSSFALLCESVFLKLYSAPRSMDILIFTVPAAFFLFHIAININLKDKPIYKRLRNVGMLIFCLHLFVYDILIRVIHLANRVVNIDLSPFMFLICTVSVTLLSFFIVWLADNKFKWLKYLYS